MTARTVRRLEGGKATTVAAEEYGGFRNDAVWGEMKAEQIPEEIAIGSEKVEERQGGFCVIL